MSEYGFVITNQGRALLTKVLAGGQLNITRVMFGDGKLSGQDPKAFIELLSPKEAGTATLPIVQDGSVVFTLQYQNKGQSMFVLNEYGIFAEDPDEGEILLYYATLGDYPQYVMPGLGDIRRFPVSMALSANDVSVTLAFDASAFVTTADFQSFVDLAQQTIQIANEAKQEVTAMENQISQNTSKINTLWDAVFNDITTNPFQIAFTDLSGVTLSAGVWNESLRRLEC